MNTIASILCIQKIVEELLETSSSSSEDDEICAVLLERNLQPTPPKNFIENINQFTDIEFKKYLRISRKSVAFLMEKYSSSYFRRTYKGGRQQLTVEKQILSFLWFCGNKITFREVADLFEMQISTTHSSFNKVLKFLVHEMASEVIKCPQSYEEKEAIAKSFEELTGFPNVLGCIDRTNILARTPRNISITMQGICDSKLRFLNVFAALPSKIDTTGILNLTFIENDLPHICSPNYHILGDTDYPLREFLLTPFEDTDNLGESEKIYNSMLYETRAKIESAFCILKCRFRQLMRLDFHKVETMAKFIIGCCVLHNICIDRGDFYDEEIAEIEFNSISSEPFVDDRRDKMLSQLGQMKRNEIKDILFTKTT